jgi:transglutaminase-like putative cysteine protease
MRIGVMHEACFSYDRPASGVIQMLRLTPRNHAGQYVVDWRIDLSADCRLEPQQDAFGNIVHAFSTGEPLIELRVLVEGEVETQDTAGVVNCAVERFPPSLYLRETPLVRPDEAIAAYARTLRGSGDARPAGPEGILPALHRLLGGIHQDVAWTPDAPHCDGTAAAAFAARHGTCRDLAQIFIAAARALDIPARYVAGYLCGGSGDGAAAPDGGAPSEDVSAASQGVDSLDGHAWAEAHVPGLGWVGFDPANGLCATDRHVRVAIGLDSLGAAPIRRANFGGSGEARAVKLAVVVAQARGQSQG